MLGRHFHDRCPLSVLAAEVGISLRTAYNWLARYRSGGTAALVDRRSVRCIQRRTLDPLQLQHAVALRMIHVDTKQLDRSERIGHLITGDRRLGSSRGAGYEKAHDAIDDAIRLAYVEVLPVEKLATTVGFLLRAVAWFDTQGITCKRVLSDNGSANRSKPWRESCIALSLTPKRTRPFIPRTNAKAERFIKTLQAE